MKNLFFAGAAVAALCACTPGAQPVDYEVATWKGFATSTISLTFDDGCPNQFTLAQPLLDKRDMKATFYPILSWVTDYSALQNAAAAGHEIGCHTVKHPNLRDMTNEEVDAEYSLTDQITRDSIGYQNMTIAYPYCSRPDGDATAKHYMAARNCDGRIEPATPADYLNISSMVCGTMSQNRTAADLQNIFAATKEAQGWTTLLFHEVGEGNGYSPFPTESLDSALQYLDENRADFWVATFHDAARYSMVRDSAKISAVLDGDAIKVSMSHSLPEDPTDVALTVAVSLPADWTSVVAKDGDAEVSVTVRDGKAIVDIKNGEQVVISRAE